jgi:hypothetical protein
VLAMTFTQSALAGTVTMVQGDVQISRDGGPFTSITGPTVCNSGDLVRAQSGFAQVVNPNGFFQTASPGISVICATDPDPASGLSKAGATEAGAATTVGAGTASGVTAGVSTAVIVGGVAVVAGVAGLVAASKKNSASP